MDFAKFKADIKITAHNRLFIVIFANSYCLKMLLSLELFKWR